LQHWLKIDWKKHPHASSKTVTEIEEEIFKASIDQGALLMRGSWFYAEKNAAHDTLFLRATYAAAPFDKINEAIRRFGAAVRTSFGLVDEEVKGEVINGEGNGHA
jgi:aromatic amino acid aminotransferase I